MAEPTPEEIRAERKKDLAEAFRDGFRMFREEEEERLAKETPEKGKEEGEGDKRTGIDFAGFLLG